jgi:hypothetical protein
MRKRKKPYDTRPRSLWGQLPISGRPIELYGTVKVGEHTSAVEAHNKADGVVFVRLDDQGALAVLEGNFLPARFGPVHVCIVAVDVHSTLLTDAAQAIQAFVLI